MFQREGTVFSTSFRNFIHDDSGAYTVWSLVWFSL